MHWHRSCVIMAVMAQVTAILCTELLYRYHWCSRESSGGATCWGSWCSIVCHLSSFAPDRFQNYSVGRKLCMALWCQCALTRTFLLISDGLNHPAGILSGNSMALASVCLTMSQSLKLKSRHQTFSNHLQQISNQLSVCSDIMSDHSKAVLIYSMWSHRIHSGSSDEHK